MQPQRRAHRLLLWYPKRWREETGVEFAAFLEDSMRDRPFWPRRGFNVVVHGMRSRVTQLRHSVSTHKGAIAAAMFATSLFFGGHAVGANYPRGLWSSKVNFLIFMKPTASASQIEKMKVWTKSSASIEDCAYLGPAASYRYAVREVSGALPTLSASNTPSVFQCLVRGRTSEMHLATYLNDPKNLQIRVGLMGGEYPPDQFIDAITVANILRASLELFAVLIVVITATRLVFTARIRSSSQHITAK